MKRAFAILLFAIFSASSFYNAFVVADYFVRFDYYANVLCENKAEPTSHCNGKCQLTAQLNNENEQEQEAPLPELNQFKVEVYVENGIAIAQIGEVFKEKRTTSHTKSLHPQEVCFNIFAPPKFIV